MKTVILTDDVHQAAKVEAAKQGIALSRFVELAILAALKEKAPTLPGKDDDQRIAGINSGNY